MSNVGSFLFKAVKEACYLFLLAARDLFMCTDRIAHTMVFDIPVVGTGWDLLLIEARCSSVVRAFAHGAMGRRIDPSWGGPIELFLVPISAPRLV